MEPMPSPAKIYNHVRQEEEQQGLNSSSIPAVDSAALNISRSYNSRQARSFQNPGNNKCQRPFCDHCNKHGHTKQTCWNPNGYPKDLPKPRDSEPHVIAAITQPPTAAPAISAAQYARLLTLLEADNDGTDVAPYANFAGSLNHQSDWME
ncbi:uncharacterized protein LOC113286412 [Papaver somniferum]|uniref:uncharacterized protein LOC113286412 n=1 Tax=Papaver somniferum TaxID=3469 RepID=UPI000E6FFDF2|nr:uncharacterized protein LOC113286412 [Papaver somniferum]